MLATLFESGAAIRRGQDRLGELAQGTKDELVKRVGTEVRGFLDKMDVVDLAQRVIGGLVVDVKAEIRFRREDGKLRPEITEADVDVRDPEPDEEES